MFATRTMTKTCPYCAEEIQEEAIKCKHCLSWLGHDNASSQARPLFGGGAKGGWRLTRTVHDRKIFGVCGGIGRLLGVDPTFVRVVYALTTAFSFVLPGLIAYFILAWAIPAEDDTREMA